MLRGCCITRQWAAPTPRLLCAAGSVFHSRVATAPPGEASRVLAAHMADVRSRAANQQTSGDGGGDAPQQQQQQQQQRGVSGFRDTRLHAPVAPLASSSSSAAGGAEADAGHRVSTPPTAADQEAHQLDAVRRRLRYQSKYRGMAELDLILGAFADVALPRATPEELAGYDDILRQLDTDLFHWLVTVPGRQRSSAVASPGEKGRGGDDGGARKAETVRNILAGTSDYGDPDKAPRGGVAGATPEGDDFIEPPELLVLEHPARATRPSTSGASGRARLMERFLIWSFFLR